MCLCPGFFICSRSAVRWCLWCCLLVCAWSLGPVSIIMPLPVQTLAVMWIMTIHDIDVPVPQCESYRQPRSETDDDFVAFTVAMFEMRNCSVCRRLAKVAKNAKPTGPIPVTAHLRVQKHACRYTDIQVYVHTHICICMCM